MNKYSKFIMSKRLRISIPILLISSLIYTIGIGLFLTSAQAFPKGLGAFSQLIVYALDLNPSFFSLFYFITNVPLFIVFWKSLGKKFVVYTLIWMIFQLAWGQLIFWINIDMNPFGFRMVSDGQYVPSGRIAYAATAALIIGISTGLSFLAGGSTGGIDFFVYYYYLKYKKSIGFYSVTLSLLAVFISMIIQFIMGDSPEKTVFRLFFGVTSFIMFLYLFIYSAILNTIYPRHKKVKLEISSEKHDQIIDNFEKTKFHHAYTIRGGWSQYSHKETKTIVTIISYMELSSVVTKLRKIDPNIWISINFIQYVFGSFSDKLLED